PSLTGLAITAAHYGDLIARADRAPRGASLDLSRAFQVATAPPPEWPDSGIDFTTPDAATYGTGYGWLPPVGWGSWTIGPGAVMEFRVPEKLCHSGAILKMRVDPYLPPSRADLETGVWVNGKLATTWHFNADGKFSSNTVGDSDKHRVMEVGAPLDTGATCASRAPVLPAALFQGRRPAAAPTAGAGSKRRVCAIAVTRCMLDAFSKCRENGGFVRPAAPPFRFPCDEDHVAGDLALSPFHPHLHPQRPAHPVCTQQAGGHVGDPATAGAGRDLCAGAGAHPGQQAA